MAIIKIIQVKKETSQNIKNMSKFISNDSVPLNDRISASK